MKMDDDLDRSDLTDNEREIVGKPGDLVSEDPVPARARSTSVMLSLRIERRTFDAIGRIAEDSGRTFSEAARDALRQYVGESGAGRPYPDREAGGSLPVRRVSESRLQTWSDEDLSAALDRYESECRSARMLENAWRSYVDYARRFLAWRTGDYRPRGMPVDGRPVARTSVSTAELREQAKQYARLIEEAGRAQATIDTYYRHAMFFIRWLGGEFRPGGRLEGPR
jgi:hypothetical protein